MKGLDSVILIGGGLLAVVGLVAGTRSTAADSALLPGGWQVSSINGQAGESFVRINTRTGATDWCYHITVPGEAFGEWRCRKMPDAMP